MLAPGESQVASLFAFSDQCFVRHPAEPGARCQMLRDRSHHLVNWVESIALSLAWKWIEAGVAFGRKLSDALYIVSFQQISHPRSRNDGPSEGYALGILCRWPWRRRRSP